MQCYIFGGHPRWRIYRANSEGDLSLHVSKPYIVSVAIVLLKEGAHSAGSKGVSSGDLGMLVAYPIGAIRVGSGRDIRQMAPRLNESQHFSNDHFHHQRCIALVCNISRVEPLPPLFYIMK